MQAKKKDDFKKNLYIKASLVLTGIIALSLDPAQTQASLLSFLIPTTQASISPVSGNSQTLALPEPIPFKSSAKKSDILVEEGALIPKTNPLGADADIDGTSENDQISIYAVHEGDSLPQVAKMFGVSVNTIRWANNLSIKDKIKEGDVLVILPVNGVSYKVKKGDTLKSIANAFKADVSEVERFNGLELDSALAIGDTLIIPEGEISEQTTKGNTGTKSGKGGLLPLVARGATRLQKGFDGADLTGYYIRPVAGGRRSQGLHGKNGVDIAAPDGTPLMAAANGTVIIARDSGFNGGFGDYVVIQHPNGTQTLYGHMSKVTVSAGQNVSQGSVIGLIGHTGLATGSHVHFEVRGAKNPLSDNPNYGL